MNRASEFQHIKSAVSSLVFSEGDNAIVINDDSLNALKFIPDHSVSLILTDPPYPTTKKQNIYQLDGIVLN